MVFKLDLQNEIHKNWFIRSIAFIITFLCVITLQDVGNPLPYRFAIPRGIIYSFILNGTLWFVSFKRIRVKLKYLVVPLTFISGIGVFIISPYGWTLAFIFLSFHFWLIYDLVTSKEKV